MEHLTILRDTISDILEEMFFLVEETPPDQIAENYHYTTSIEDPLFSMTLYMGHELAREITINFLGIPDEPDNNDVVDCLQEIVNMICGNFIGRVFPEHKVALPFPQTAPCQTPPPADIPFVLLFFRGQPMRVVYREHE